MLFVGIFEAGLARRLRAVKIEVDAPFVVALDGQSSVFDGDPFTDLRG